MLLTLMLMDGAGTGVAVGGTGVAVGGTGVAVGGTGVAVGGTGVAVGGTGVAVGGTGVAVGGTGVAVGGTGVAVGGTGVAVGITPGPCAATGPAANKRLAITSTVLTRVRPAPVRERKRPTACPTVRTQQRPDSSVSCLTSISLPYHGGRRPRVMNLSSQYLTGLCLSIHTLPRLEKSAECALGRRLR